MKMKHFFYWNLVIAKKSCLNLNQNNYILVAGGLTEKKNGRFGKCKISAKVATACETLARIGATARLFPRA